MTTFFYQLEEQRARRELWFQTVRDNIGQMLRPDGTPAMPVFSSPHREPLWVAAALYTGSQADIDLINATIARWHDNAPKPDENPLQVDPNQRETHGTHFGIFQTNTMIHLYHRFHDKLTPEVEKIMHHHVEKGPRTFRGSGQPDTKYHGANDNMPTMATQGLIFSGEILGDKNAIKQGLWYLNKLRLLLSRAAWISEFNSSTYSLVTASHLAQLACYSHTSEVRELALEIEQRLWAELLLHYHPGTFMQAGPQSRCYAVDYAGHTHSLQLAWWVIFGPEISGRDPIRSFFKPDGREVIHFEGNPWQSIAEFVHFLDGDLHVPVELAKLFTERNYPARLRGRAEAMSAYDLSGQAVHTTTYMEKEFSLGTSDVPWNVDQCANFYVTYQRTPAPKDFRDAAPVFLKYRFTPTDYGSMAQSSSGPYEGERHTSSDGWVRTLQKDNVALVQVTPRLTRFPKEGSSMRVDLIFPSHYGKITRTIIGDGPVRDGATGESVEVVPVSIEEGEVFIHVYPLIPTNMARTAAIRFTSHHGRYEVLELINYEGPAREFSRRELELIGNGFVITVDAKKKHASLEEFHRAKSKAWIVDYFLADLRFVEFHRDDVWFEHSYGPRTGTVMTEAIDGRTVPQPVIESNQLDVAKLPFMSGPVAPNFPFFPYKDSLEICWYPDASWIIGSRGVPEEVPYSKRNEMLRIKPEKKVSQLAIGIVGLNFGRWILEELQRQPASDYFHLGAVCDIDGEKVRSFADKLKVKAYTDLDSLLADPGIAVIGLYTGPAGRADLLRKIIRAGKDVMTTKPFELDPAAARSILEEAASLGRVIFLNSPPPLPAKWMEQVMAWQKEFNLGSPISAHAEAMAHYAEKADGSWYDDPERCPAAPVFRIGIYLINDLVRLFGGVDCVQVLGSRVLTGRPTLDNANLNMLFKNGAVGSIHANFCVDDGQYYSNSFVIHYERGTIHRNIRFMPYGKANLGSRLQLVALTGERKTETREIELFDDGSDYQWEVLHDTITRRKVIPMPIDDIVHGVQVIAAMKRAEKSRRSESV